MLDVRSFEALAAARINHFGAAPVPQPETFGILVLRKHLEKCVLLDADGETSAIFRFVGPTGPQFHTTRSPPTPS